MQFIPTFIADAGGPIMRQARLMGCIVCLMLTAQFFPYLRAADYVLQSRGLIVNLTQDGKVASVTLGGQQIRWKASGETELVGCRIRGEVASSRREDGSVHFTKELQCDDGGTPRDVTLRESFSPTPDSIRWEIEIDGHGSPWSTPIKTRFQFPGAKTKQFWTAWGDPRPDDPYIKSTDWSTLYKELGDLIGSKRDPGWADPLTLGPLRDRKFWYGAPYYQRQDPRIFYVPIYRDVFCIPLATIVDEKDDVGLSIVQSPEDALLDMTLDTSAAGQVDLARLFRRISEGKPVHYSVDLVGGQADWRDGLGWMSTRYAQYFNPPLAKAGEYGGTAAYSSYEGPLDTAKLKRMAFTVNWKASFDFPYQGMFIPPVADNQEWDRGYTSSETPPFYLGPKTSIPAMAAYSRRMRALGFYVMDYYNVAEFGKNIVYPPPPPRRKLDDPDLWKDPTDYLYAHFSDAILYRPDGEKQFYDPSMRQMSEPGPVHCARGNVVLDWGIASWQNFLLDQARKLIEKVPDSSGIAIDRLDWIRLYNFRADDGVTWYGGPARSLINSWNEMFAKLGPLEHNAGRVILVNYHVKRLDVLNQVDGLFDEITMLGPSKNSIALLGMKKPTIGWVREEDKFIPDPDTFMQTFLYLGVFPMAPYPQNDHSILPSAFADKVYLDYGPLFIGIRGRKWVLLPHVISVTGGMAKGNIFRVGKDYVAPVMFGGKAPIAQVTLSGLIPPGVAARCEVLHPGETTWKACKFVRTAGRITADVPLSRGCALLRVRAE